MRTVELIEIKGSDSLQASDTLETGGRLSQKFGADLSQQGHNSKVSGDADLPSKVSLADRRAKVDNVSTLLQQSLGCFHTDALTQKHELVLWCRCSKS